ncbi:pentapeptide repeat-containing protein [Streptomyces sp. ID03-2B]|uniref:pentapeptide repeat-containing protein n=1 Tax=Streptomyces sp. ID03-2B TaxID=3028660 RepID=UPI0029B7DB47|nr:pentapeptide repeat-containing protein [Streptomyces sp. ID03-2B]MDX3591379.1 pentapeptide repeat-containing protein [Streptomyces sp. ID03-2B]
MTERFRASIEQIASDKIEVRLGGVYGLENVLKESPQDHTAIVDVLAGYVRNATYRGPSGLELPHERNSSHREHAWGTELPVDLQAAVTVLARRPDRREPRRVDLRHAHLAGMSLRHFEFDSPPRLAWMFLTSADLSRSDLRGVDFRGSIMNYADFCLGWLAGARLDGVGLFAADLRGTHLLDAELAGADLRSADLRESDVTAEQLSVAAIDATTRLPDSLQNDSWVAARLEECGNWDRANRSQRTCAPPTPPSPRV